MLFDVFSSPIKSYITSYLQYYLSKYIQGIQLDGLGVFGSDIVLYDLELKRHVLQESLDIPAAFDISRGFVRELRIMIPWTKLLSQAIQVKLYTIELIIQEKEDKACRSSTLMRQSSIDDLQEAPNATWLQSMLHKILANVSVQLSNVVVKYQQAELGFSTAIGQLQLYSTNDKWEKHFLEPSAENTTIYKILEGTDISIFLDKTKHKAASIYEMPVLNRACVSSRIRTSLNHVGEVGSVPCTHSVLLELLVLGQAYANCACSELQRSLVSMEIDIFIGSLPISLSEMQLLMLHKIVQSFKNSTQGSSNAYILEFDNGFVQDKNVHENMVHHASNSGQKINEIGLFGTMNVRLHIEEASLSLLSENINTRKHTTFLRMYLNTILLEVLVYTQEAQQNSKKGKNSVQAEVQQIEIIFESLRKSLKDGPPLQVFSCGSRKCTSFHPYWTRSFFKSSNKKQDPTPDHENCSNEIQNCLDCKENGLIGVIVDAAQYMVNHLDAKVDLWSNLVAVLPGALQAAFQLTYDVEMVRYIASRIVAECAFVHNIKFKQLEHVVFSVLVKYMHQIVCKNEGSLKNAALVVGILHENDLSKLDGRIDEIDITSVNVSFGSIEARLSDTLVHKVMEFLDPLSSPFDARNKSRTESSHARSVFNIAVHMPRLNFWIPLNLNEQSRGDHNSILWARLQTQNVNMMSTIEKGSGGFTFDISETSLVYTQITPTGDVRFQDFLKVFNWGGIYSWDKARCSSVVTFTSIRAVIQLNFVTRCVAYLQHAFFSKHIHDYRAAPTFSDDCLCVTIEHFGLDTAFWPQQSLLRCSLYVFSVVIQNQSGKYLLRPDESVHTLQALINIYYFGCFTKSFPYVAEKEIERPHFNDKKTLEIYATSLVCDAEGLAKGIQAINNCLVYILMAFRTGELIVVEDTTNLQHCTLPGLSNFDVRVEIRPSIVWCSSLVCVTTPRLYLHHDCEIISPTAYLEISIQDFSVLYSPQYYKLTEAQYIVKPLMVDLTLYYTNGLNRDIPTWTLAANVARVSVYTSVEKVIALAHTMQAWMVSKPKCGDKDDERTHLRAPFHSFKKQVQLNFELCIQSFYAPHHAIMFEHQTLSRHIFTYSISQILVKYAIQHIQPAAFSVEIKIRHLEANVWSKTIHGWPLMGLPKKAIFRILQYCNIEGLSQLTRAIDTPLKNQNLYSTAYAAVNDHSKRYELVKDLQDSLSLRADLTGYSTQSIVCFTSWKDSNLNIVDHVELEFHRNINENVLALFCCPAKITITQELMFCTTEMISMISLSWKQRVPCCVKCALHTLHPFHDDTRPPVQRQFDIFGLCSSLRVNLICNAILNHSSSITEQSQLAIKKILIRSDVRSILKKLNGNWTCRYQKLIQELDTKVTVPDPTNSDIIATIDMVEILYTRFSKKDQYHEVVLKHASIAQQNGVLLSFDHGLRRFAFSAKIVDVQLHSSFSTTFLQTIAWYGEMFTICMQATLLTKLNYAAVKSIQGEYDIVVEWEGIHLKMVSSNHSEISLRMGDVSYMNNNLCQQKQIIVHSVEAILDCGPKIQHTQYILRNIRNSRIWTQGDSQPFLCIQWNEKQIIAELDSVFIFASSTVVLFLGEFCEGHLKSQSGSQQMYPKPCYVQSQRCTMELCQLYALPQPVTYKILFSPIIVVLHTSEMHEALKISFSEGMLSATRSPEIQLNKPIHINDVLALNCWKWTAAISGISVNREPSDTIFASLSNSSNAKASILEQSWFRQNSNVDEHKYSKSAIVRGFDVHGSGSLSAIYLVKDFSNGWVLSDTFTGGYKQNVDCSISPIDINISGELCIMLSTMFSAYFSQDLSPTCFEQPEPANLLRSHNTKYYNGKWCKVPNAKYVTLGPHETAYTITYIKHEHKSKNIIMLPHFHGAEYIVLNALIEQLFCSNRTDLQMVGSICWTYQVPYRIYSIKLHPLSMNSAKLIINWPVCSVLSTFYMFADLVCVLLRWDVMDKKFVAVSRIQFSMCDTIEREGGVLREKFALRSNSIDNPIVLGDSNRSSLNPYTKLPRSTIQNVTGIRAIKLPANSVSEKWKLEICFPVECTDDELRAEISEKVLKCMEITMSIANDQFPVNSIQTLVPSINCHILSNESTSLKGCISVYHAELSVLQCGSDDMSVSLASTLQVEVQDASSFLRYMVIEPTDFRCITLWNRASMNIDIHCSSININISKSSIAAILDITYELSHGLNACIELNSGIFVFNSTAEVIRFGQHGCAESIELLPKQHMQYYWRRSVTARVKSLGNTRMLQFRSGASETWGSGVPLEYSTLLHYRMNHKSEFYHIWICIDVEGSAVNVHLRSDLSVHNRSGIPMEFLVSPTNIKSCSSCDFNDIASSHELNVYKDPKCGSCVGNADISSCPTQSCCRIAIPTTAEFNSEISIRPTRSGEAYNWQPMSLYCKHKPMELYESSRKPRSKVMQDDLGDAQPSAQLITFNCHEISISFWIVTFRVIQDTNLNIESGHGNSQACFCWMTIEIYATAYILNNLNSKVMYSLPFDEKSTNVVLPNSLSFCYDRQNDIKELSIAVVNDDNTALCTGIFKACSTAIDCTSAIITYDLQSSFSSSVPYRIRGSQVLFSIISIHYWISIINLTPEKVYVNFDKLGEYCSKPGARIFLKKGSDMEDIDRLHMFNIGFKHLNKIMYTKTSWSIEDVRRKHVRAVIHGNNGLHYGFSLCHAPTSQHDSVALGDIKILPLVQIINRTKFALQSAFPIIQAPHSNLTVLELPSGSCIACPVICAENMDAKRKSVSVDSASSPHKFSWFKKKQSSVATPDQLQEYKVSFKLRFAERGLESNFSPLVELQLPLYASYPATSNLMIPLANNRMRCMPLMLKFSSDLQDSTRVEIIRQKDVSTILSNETQMAMYFSVVATNEHDQEAILKVDLYVKAQSEMLMSKSLQASEKCCLKFRTENSCWTDLFEVKYGLQFVSLRIANASNVDPLQTIAITSFMRAHERVIKFCDINSDALSIRRPISLKKNQSVNLFVKVCSVGIFDERCAFQANASTAFFRQVLQLSAHAISLQVCVSASPPKEAQHESSLGYMNYAKIFTSLDIEVSKLQIEHYITTCKFPVTFSLTSESKVIPDLSAAFKCRSVLVQPHDAFEDIFVYLIDIAFGKVAVQIEEKLFHVLRQILFPLVVVIGSHQLCKFIKKGKQSTEEALIGRNIEKLCVKKLFISDVTAEITVHALSKSYVNVDQAVLLFSAYSSENMLQSIEQILKDLAANYAADAVLQSPLLFGSFSGIGNPTGLVRDILRGFSDLISLPMKAISTNIGVYSVSTAFVLGAESMIRHVSHGGLTSISGIGNGLSATLNPQEYDTQYFCPTFESDDADEAFQFQHDRTHLAAQSVSKGIAEFRRSIVSAITGVVKSPLDEMHADKGYSRQLTGLVVGLGKGVIGAIAKPTGGMAGLIAHTSEGLYHSTGLGRISTAATRVQWLKCPVNIELYYQQQVLRAYDEPILKCCIAALSTQESYNLGTQHTLTRDEVFEKMQLNISSQSLLAESLFACVTIVLMPARLLIVESAQHMEQVLCDILFQDVQSLSFKDISQAMQITLSTASNVTQTSSSEILEFPSYVFYSSNADDAFACLAKKLLLESKQD